MTRVAVIDYGMGNLHSMAKALEHATTGTDVLVTADPEKILATDHVVFPGVGAVRDCIDELQRHELDAVIREVAASKPLLGVCLGMQALLEFSEENDGTDCLGIFPGQVRHFGAAPTDPASGEVLKVPHMGWNQVRQRHPHPLWHGIEQDTWFYFVHSYYAAPTLVEHTAAVADYGREFTAVLARENIFAVQFHPEKSHHAGLTLLANFLQWDGSA